MLWPPFPTLARVAKVAGVTTEAKGGKGDYWPKGGKGGYGRDTKGKGRDKEVKREAAREQRKR